MKEYTNIEVKKLPNQEVLITGEITVEKMNTARTKALESLKKELSIAGFRKGHAPDDKVVQHVGDLKILEEAGEIALGDVYPHILENEKIDAIGKPNITITKIGVGSPLGFTIKTALSPEVTLGDYAKIARTVHAEKKEITVTEKEIDDVVDNLRKHIAHQDMHAQSNLGEHDHSHGEIADEHLPEIDDVFLKRIGNFKDIADFRTKIQENIQAEKAMKQKDEKRTTLLEKIIEKSTILLPQIIIDGEMERMKAQLSDDLARSGITYEQYLEHIKKTEEEIKADWKEPALKRAQSQIILNTIAREQHITPPEEDVKKEMEVILSQHKTADRFRVRMYVEMFLTNELVFTFLEKEGGK